MEGIWKSFVALLKGFVGFLKEYNLSKTIELTRRLDWHEILTNPLFWLIVIPSTAFLVYKKMFRLIVLFLSAFAFVLLAQKTLSPAGQSMPFDDLLLFLGGCTVLLAINFYLLFIRGD